LTTINLQLRLQRLSALHGLSSRLAGESGGGLLGDSLDTLLERVASWLRAGNPLLGKPTHFEERTGAF